MNRLRHNTGLVFVSWALLLIFGCHKKKPPIPPEETPPTIISQIPTESAETPASQQPPVNPPQEQQANNTPPPEKPVHKTPKHPKSHPPAPRNQASEPDKPAPTEEARNLPPPRVVIQEGGANTSPGQVASSVPGDNSTAGQSSTQQLLDSTENNLRNIKRKLSGDEESMVAQIRDYIKQSKDATKDGDHVRAHNLALRAHLLSDELAKTQ